MHAVEITGALDANSKYYQVVCKLKNVSVLGRRILQVQYSRSVPDCMPFNVYMLESVAGFSLDPVIYLS